MQLLSLDRPDHFLTWNTRLEDDADFLPLDPLALDYLGQQVGLWLFPALTTRTDRAQYFAVVIYGLYTVALRWKPVPANTTYDSTSRRCHLKRH